MKLSRISPLSLNLFIAVLALSALSFAEAASEDANQRQLREDRARFQREIDRQTTDAKIREDQARMAAEQQRTAAELERLRSQQDRQSSEIRSLTDTSRVLTDTSATVPSPRIAASLAPLTPPADSTSATATITPDFSVTLLADGQCVVYVKGRPPEVKSAAEAQASFEQLLAAKKSPNAAP